MTQTEERWAQAARVLSVVRGDIALLAAVAVTAHAAVACVEERLVVLRRLLAESPAPGEEP